MTHRRRLGHMGEFHTVLVMNWFWQVQFLSFLFKLIHLQSFLQKRTNFSGT